MPDCIVEPVVGVGDLVANEIVGAAVEGVGARTRDHVDNRGAGKSIFGAEVRLLHLELFHRFRGRSIGDVSDAAIGLEVGDRSAIHQNVGIGAAAAIGHEVRSGVADRVLVAHVVHTRREHHKVHHITVNQRQIVDEPAVDHLARHRILGVEGLRLGLDVDGLRRGGDLQTQIRRRVLADVQRDAGAHRLSQSRGTSADTEYNPGGIEVNRYRPTLSDVAAK